MDKPENVRLAEPEDMEAIYWSLYRTYSEDNDLGIPISPKAIFQKVEAMCNRQGGCAGVIDGPHGIVASIALQAVPFWFGYDEQPFITEIWCYVVKQYRKESRFLTDLFNFAEWHRQDMSERLGYNIVLENAVLSLHRLPAMMRVYERFYGAPVGGVFWSRGDEEDVSQQQQQENLDNEPVESGGPKRLQRPALVGAEPLKPTAQPLRRPARRAPEPDPEHGDSGHRGRTGGSATLFD